MKVLMINCSPHTKGSTDRALKEIAGELAKAKITSEIYQLPRQPLQSCLGCGKCRDSGVCVIADCVNELSEKAKAADGLVVGSPVHFAGISGAGKTVLDRLFYSSRGALARKPFAALVIARRAGTTSALEQLNKYPIISNMLLVGSQYWPMVFGNNAAELEQDLEGLQILRSLARNMALVLKALPVDRDIKTGEEKPQRTNFIR